MTPSLGVPFGRKSPSTGSPFHEKSGTGISHPTWSLLIDRLTTPIRAIYSNRYEDRTSDRDLLHLVTSNCQFLRSRYAAAAFAWFRGEIPLQPVAGGFTERRDPTIIMLEGLFCPILSAVRIVIAPSVVARICNPMASRLNWSGLDN